MKIKNSNRKGFTLIELLVVIAIVAILSVVVILSLNPAELLKQARDSNRVSDMATLKSAISLYMADVSSPFIGTSTLPNFSLSAVNTSAAYFESATNTWGMSSAATSTALSTTTRGVGGVGSGWLPVNFNLISSGAPIGALPIDPVNVSTTVLTGTTGTFYGYMPLVASTSFKLVTHMESTKYSNGGGSDVVSTDGGVSSTTYEQGTALTL